MKLVDPSGNEVTSKENKDAKELEKQMSRKIEALLEPVMNKVQLSGAQIPQQQLMQLSSAAQQMLFNRMIYNLLIQEGLGGIDEERSAEEINDTVSTLIPTYKI